MHKNYQKISNYNGDESKVVKWLLTYTDLFIYLFGGQGGDCSPLTPPPPPMALKQYPSVHFIWHNCESEIIIFLKLNLVNYGLKTNGRALHVGCKWRE